MTATDRTDAPSVGAIPFSLERLGVVMSPLAGEPTEACGVLNPATARGGGEVFLFPRMVADGNYSRIGRARVIFNAAGIPVDVERRGVVLEPEEAWELHVGGGGVEDPRITYLPRLSRWIMTYTAFGPLGPRIGLATSADLEHWERLGPVSFAYDPGLATDLNLYPNKDAVIFPEPVADPTGSPAYAMLHRPMWDLSLARPGEDEPLPAGLADPRPGIWVSFVAAAAVEADLRALTRLDGHRPVALPERPWEALKIGAGPPPVRIAEGWLVLYHGVDGTLSRDLQPQADVHYAAGALILDARAVTRVVARSADPLLEPELADELTGTVPNVVFPTAIEPLDEGASSSYHVYYGMADLRIGVALLRRTGPQP
ncbi:MAG: glycosidase [Chloroflexota bacterium]|nr:glycosidase [Chloroflexota bacterium]